MPKKHLFFLLSFLFLAIATKGQQTEAFRGSDLKYFDALELMNHGQFEAARRGFGEYLKQSRDPNGELHVNAVFYHAKSTMELFHKDAEFLMEEFVLKHPESTWKDRAVFSLGSYNFNRRDYDDALYWFNRLDERDLKPSEREEVQFKKGFSAFELGRFEEAKASFFPLKDKRGDYYGPTNYYYGHIAYTEGNYQTALESLDKAAEDPNFAPVIPYYKTQIYHFQGKYDELIAYASPMMEDEETVRQEEIAELLGNAHYQKQNYALAVPYLELHASRTYNLSSEEAYRLGYAYYRTGEFAKAVDKLAVASKAENGSLAQIATYQLGDAYVQLGEKKYAQNAFKVASQMDFDQAVTEDALFNYAKLAYELSYDPFHEAIQAFERYLENYPNSNRKDEAYEFLLKVHLATKNYEAAITALNNIKTLNPVQKGLYQQAAYNYGVSLMNKQSNSEALDKFKLSKKYSQDPKLVALADYWTGDILYRTGDYESAVAAYRAFLANSAAYQTAYYNTANYNIGYSTFKGNDYQESLTAFRKYVSAANTDKKRKNDAYLRIGDLNLVKKSYDQAIESYESALALNDANGDYALFQIGQAYGYRDQFEKKVSALNRLFDDYPETTLSAVAHFEQGDSYFMLNNLNSALTSFNKVINDYPQSPFRKRALLKRGLVQYRKNDYDGAIASFKQVVEDYGVDGESNEAVATLKNIYLDLGKVEEFSDWLGGIPDYEISPSEIDSLTYQSAENLVADGNCEGAIVSFENYLKKYPNGLFVPDANFYMAECAYRRNEYDKALKGFEYIAARPVNRYSEPALLGAANIRFSRKEYEEALEHFTKLAEVATFASNILEARVGKMRAAYQVGNYSAAVDAADKVLLESNASEAEITEARLLKARILFIDKKYDQAAEIYAQVAKKQNSKEGAEAKYRLAEIAFIRKNLPEAEKEIFDLVSNFQAYDFWKIKGFLLLADVYIAKEDFFQARATLESIVNNVKDDQFVKEAKDKLAALENAESAKIAAGDTIPGADTLDYEEDYRDLIENNDSPKK